MKNKSKLELIKEYIENCPLLRDGKIAVDYLGDEVDSYSIDQNTANPILEEYIGGGSLRQIVFDFAVVEPFSKLENLANSKFCEDFTKWVELQNETGNLPDIKGADEIKCTAPGKIIQKTDTLAVYVIPMQFVYMNEKGGI